MVKKGVLAAVILALVVTLVACADGDQMARDDAKLFNAHGEKTMHRGGAHEGPKGKAYRSLYRDADQNERGIRPFGQRLFGLDRDSGLRDHRFDGSLDSRRMQEEQPGLSRALGFSESTTRNDQSNFQSYGTQAYIDRQLLAETVAQVIAGLPDVDSATVLVTDEECLIGYTTERNGKETKEQVELSALSATPRWYKVYSTADPGLTEHIRQIAQQYTQNYDAKNFHNEVNALIQQLER